MKLKLIIAASAGALALFFATYQVYAWIVGCSTTYGGGQWHDCESTHAYNTTSGIGSFVLASASSGQLCYGRADYGWDDQGSGARNLNTSRSCPDPTLYNTPECCVKAKPIMYPGYCYWTTATQLSNNHWSCPSVGASISNLTLNCEIEAPGGQ